MSFNITYNIQLKTQFDFHMRTAEWYLKKLLEKWCRRPWFPVGFLSCRRLRKHGISNDWRNVHAKIETLCNDACMDKASQFYNFQTLPCYAFETATYFYLTKLSGKGRSCQSLTLKAKFFRAKNAILWARMYFSTKPRFSTLLITCPVFLSRVSIFHCLTILYSLPIAGKLNRLKMRLAEEKFWISKGYYYTKWLLLELTSSTFPFYFNYVLLSYTVTSS